jgi:hypothetical protein
MNYRTLGRTGIQVSPILIESSWSAFPMPPNIIVLAGADITLDDDVLDRIDEIAQPGTDAGPNDVACTPPAVSNVSLRRRPVGERSAA